MSLIWEGAVAVFKPVAAFCVVATIMFTVIAACAWIAGGWAAAGWAFANWHPIAGVAVLVAWLYSVGVLSRLYR